MPNKRSQETAPLRMGLAQPDASSHKPLAAIVYGALVAALLFGGIGPFCYGIVAPDASGELLLMVGILASALMSVCWRVSKARTLALIILAVWIAGFVLFLPLEVSDGFKLVANNIGELIGASVGRVSFAYEVTTAPENYSLVTTLFLLPVALLLAVFCGYSSRRSLAVINLILAAALFAAAQFFEVYPPLWASLVLVLAQAVLLSSRFWARHTYDGAEKASTALSHAPLLVCLAVGLALALVLAPEQYSVPAATLQARDAVVQTVNDARYGVDTSRGMPDGNLRELGPLALSDEIALEVTMEKPQSLWLRGFVGEDYTGTRWQQASPHDIFSYGNEFYWLHKDGFYGQTQLANVASLLDAQTADTASAISLINRGASSKNIYAPYEVSWANEELLPQDGIGDTSLYSEGFLGQRDYGYITYSNQVKRYPTLVSLLDTTQAQDPVLVERYLALEGNYAAYAQEEYLDISPELEELFEESFESYLKSDEATSYTTYKRAIISYLTSTVSYEDNPLAIAGSDDFVLTFLSSTKEGYSIHYASAATMLFRYCGIPARYVEGYLITPGDVAGLKSASTVLLDGTHAHAWTEIYIDGIGWIPVEVTPPYFGLMEEPDSYEGVTGAESEEPKEEDSLDGEDTTSDNAVADFSSPSNRVVFIVAGILAVLVIISLCIIGLVRRRRIINAREQLFASDDNAQAIRALYNYCVLLLQTRGLEKTTVMLIKTLEQALIKVTSSNKEQFPYAFELYQEAAYAAHEPSDEKRTWMHDYKEAILQETQESASWWKNLRNRFLLCLY